MDRASLTPSPRPARRYDAVVVVGDAAWSRPATVEMLGALCAAGVAVAVIGVGRASDIADRFAGVDPGAGVLLVAATADPWCVIIEGHGRWVVAAHDDRSRLLANGEDAVGRWVTAELWKRGFGHGDVVVVLDGDATTSGQDDAALRASGVTVVSGGLDEVVAEQRARRQRAEQPWVLPDPGWDITTDRFDLERLRVNGSLFALADGMVGTSGAPLASYPGLYRWVVAGGVYVGEGRDTRLVTAPIAMQLPYEAAEEPLLRRVLDLHTGVLHEEATTSRGTLASVRFSSLARPGTVVFRAHCPGSAPQGPSLLPPADDTALDDGADGEVTWMRVAGTPGGVVAAALDERRSVEGDDVVDRVAVYDAAGDDLPSPEEAIRRARQAIGAGFDALLAEQRAAWAARWEDADIVIEGDDDLQRAIRFALFHLMASVKDDGEAAVGCPGVERNRLSRPRLLGCRHLHAAVPGRHPSGLGPGHARVPAAPPARGAGHRPGNWAAKAPASRGSRPTPAGTSRPPRHGTGPARSSRSAPVSSKSTSSPRWRGRRAAMWTGPAMRTSPGVPVWACSSTPPATGRRGSGATPTAAHIYGVIGPDEYHEPVDDNAFTNVMARWNLRRAADAVLAAEASGVTAAEAARWRAIADALVDGYDPDTGIYEQFAGFYHLEPLIIAEVAPPAHRRRRPAWRRAGAGRPGDQAGRRADAPPPRSRRRRAGHAGAEPALLRTADRPRQLAVAGHPRLAVRPGRDYDPALEALRIAARIDLDDLTGTTGGGLHLATMGSVWQALAYGFAGLRPRGGRLAIDPRLPPAWAALEIRVRFHGSRVRVRVERDGLRIDSDGPVPVTVAGDRPPARRPPAQLAPARTALGGDDMTTVIAAIDNSAAARPVLVARRRVGPRCWAPRSRRCYVTEDEGQTARASAESFGVPFAVVEGEPLGQIAARAAAGDVVAVAIGARRRLRRAPRRSPGSRGGQ